MSTLLALYRLLSGLLRVISYDLFGLTAEQNELSLSSAGVEIFMMSSTNWLNGSNLSGTNIFFTIILFVYTDVNMCKATHVPYPKPGIRTYWLYSGARATGDRGQSWHRSIAWVPDC